MNTKTLLSEIETATSRLRETAIVDYKQELAENIYPLLQLVVRNQQRSRKDIEERIALCEDTIAELMTGTEDRIHERLAGRIQATVELGLQAIALVATKATAEHPLEPDFLLAAQAYRDSAGVLMQMVEDVLVTDDDDDTDDEEEEPHDDGHSEHRHDGRGRVGSGGDQRAPVKAEQAKAKPEERA